VAVAIQLVISLDHHVMLPKRSSMCEPAGAYSNPTANDPYNRLGGRPKLLFNILTKKFTHNN